MLENCRICNNSTVRIRRTNNIQRMNFLLSNENFNNSWQNLYSLKILSTQYAKRVKTKVKKKKKYNEIENEMRKNSN